MRNYQKKQLGYVFIGLFVLSFFLSIISPTDALSQDYLFRYGQINRRIELQTDYNGFLKDRYAADHIDIKGKFTSFVYFLKKKIGFGLELSKMEGSFDYLTLNGDLQTNKLFLTQFLISLNYFPSKNWEFVLGNGFNTIKRKFYGYKNETIIVKNLPDNSGVSDSNNEGNAFIIQAVYRLMGSRGVHNTFGLDLGLRYTYSLIPIPVGIETRPAYDNKGVPISSNFDLSGLGYNLAFAIAF